MAEVPVDLTNVVEIDALPAGEYNCTVSKAELAPSKRTPGNTNIVLEYTVQDGEYHGRMIFDNLSLAEKALWRVKDFITQLGMPVSASGFKTEDLLGQMLIVGVVQEPRMQQDSTTGQLVAVPGKSRNKVTGYKKYGS
jgi:hypothetical protein